MVNRFTGDYRSAFTLWWFEPAKEAALKASMANNTQLQINEVDVMYWPEYLKQANTRK